MNKKALIAGIVLIIGGAVGSTMEVPTTWHYFGTGVVTGIGAAILFFSFYSGAQKKS